MFVIACKFNRNNPIIFDCVDAIRRHHPGVAICVVDSGSDDKSYFNELGDSVTVLDVNNLNYSLEAYHIAFKHFPDVEYFYFIHDSLIIQDNISFIEKDNLKTIRWWSYPPVEMGWDYDGKRIWDWANEQMLEHLGYGVPDNYKGIFGPMFMCKRHVMEELIKTGMFDILPETKNQSCATERICGIVLSNLGFDVTNSFQGYGGEIYDKYDETYVKKVHLLRN